MPFATCASFVADLHLTLFDSLPLLTIHISHCTGVGIKFMFAIMTVISRKQHILCVCVGGRSCVC